VEFRCSLYLFLTIIGTARLRTRLRFLCLAGIMAFVYRNDHWELLLFYSGMFLAELDLIRGAHNPPSSLPLLMGEKEPSKQQSQWWSLFWAFLSIIALYFMCQPDLRYNETPGWIWLCSLIPEWWSVGYRYWQSVGAVVFVLCVGHSPAWQRFFNCAVVQYFGRISYAIYLMHGPVMHTVGYMWERWAWGLTGVEGWWYNAGFCLGAAFCIPSVIWAADIFWRLVDIPTVRFAKWLEARCSIQD
jgi:peptidoglycan/LPS O-acetylase OafA/YrhL